jgi:hypothetical protein
MGRALLHQNAPGAAMRCQAAHGRNARLRLLVIRFCQIPRQSRTGSSPWAVFGRIRAYLVGAEQQMRCLSCGSANVAERLERTAQGYRRFRCRECGRQFNERTAGVLNRTQYPSDVIALVVL